MRKLTALLGLVAVAAALVFLSRQLRRSDDLHATVVFDRPSGLAAGAPIVEEGRRLGRVVKVTPLQGQEALSIEVGAPFRNRLLTDSLLRPAADGRGLEVVNKVAVGTPLKEGEIVRVGDDRVAWWLAAKRDEMAPALDRATAGIAEWARRIEPEGFDRQLDEWTARVPQWKKEGAASLQRHLDDVKAHGRALEKSLRERGRAADADRVRERVERWLAEHRPRMD